MPVKWKHFETPDNILAQYTIDVKARLQSTRMRGVFPSATKVTIVATPDDALDYVPAADVVDGKWTWTIDVVLGRRGPMLGWYTASAGLTHDDQTCRGRSHEIKTVTTSGRAGTKNGALNVQW